MLVHQGYIIDTHRFELEDGFRLANFNRGSINEAFGMRISSENETWLENNKQTLILSAEMCM